MDLADLLDAESPSDILLVGQYQQRGTLDSVHGISVEEISMVLIPCTVASDSLRTVKCGPVNDHLADLLDAESPSKVLLVGQHQ